MPRGFTTDDNARDRCNPLNGLGIWDERNRVDPGRLDAVARMGGSTYSTTRDRFELRRPTYADLVGDAPA